MTRHSWKTAAVPPLALDMSGTAIRLMTRTADGEWRELGAAMPDEADFARRMDVLRVEALVRARGPVAIDLWVPSDQVLVRHWALPAGVPGHALALRRLAAETGHAPQALSLAIAPARVAGGRATVLAVPTQTVREARDYARRWGFLPGRISTRVEADRFGAAGPRLAPAPTRAGRALGTASATAAALAAVVVGVAALGAMGMPEDAPAAVLGTGPGLAHARIDATLPDLQSAGFTRVGRDRPQRLAEGPRPAEESAGTAPGARVAAPRIGLAPELAAPSEGGAMSVATGPMLPRHLRPDRLARLAAPRDDADLTALLLGIDRIREAARDRATVPSRPPVVLAAAMALPPISAAPTMPAGTTLPGAEAATAAKAAIFAAAGAVFTSAGGVPVVLAAAKTVAPRTVPAAPPPRPESEPASATNPHPAPDAAGVAVPEPRPEDEAAADAAENDSGPVSDLAAGTTPRPPQKPEKKAKRFRQAAAHRAIAAGEASPTNVRAAASKHGLQLDSTSLIGVLDAKSGRQALLRLSAGDYRKVGRGDVVDGWRVSTINRDSVRLTHGSQSRTLLLVTR